MKIAYLMLIHQDPELAYRVSKKLTAETPHHVFIHVDKKVDISPFKKLGALGPQVHLLDNRINVWWGASVDALLLLMRKAISTQSFDYYQILQGSDYPIVSNEEISKYLNTNIGTEFINAYCESNAFFNKVKAKYILKWYLDGRTSSYFD